MDIGRKYFFLLNGRLPPKHRIMVIWRTYDVIPPKFSTTEIGRKYFLASFELRKLRGNISSQVKIMFF